MDRAELVRNYYVLDLVIDEPPADWVEQVLAWLGKDGDPDDSDAVIEALIVLGFHKGAG